MAPGSESLIYFYNEGIIQLGFIVFFACVFPLAPLFSFATNLLEVNIKLNRMSRFSRRFQAQGASGIGSWTGVMELISLVAIPINIAILLFTGKGKDENGDYGYSATVERLLEKDAIVSPFEVALILVLVEHIVLGIKVVIANLVPDVPKEVQFEERRRPILEEISEKEMLKLKRAHSLKTIEEIMGDI